MIVPVALDPELVNRFLIGLIRIRGQGFLDDVGRHQEFVKNSADLCADHRNEGIRLYEAKLQVLISKFDSEPECLGFDIQYVLL